MVVSANVYKGLKDCVQAVLVDQLSKALVEFHVGSLHQVGVRSTVPLNFRQREALGVLDWLLDQDGQRQTGRTFVIAVSLIRQAIRRSPQHVYLIDHYAQSPRMNHRVIRDMVLHLTESDPDLMGRAHIDVQDDRFSIQPLAESRPLPDGPSWLPPESVLGVMAGNLRSDVAEALTQEQRIDALLNQARGAGQAEPLTRYDRMLNGDLDPDESPEPGE